MGLATVGVAASAASALVGAVGAISSANAQSQAASYQAQVAQNNATIAKQQAEVSSAAGEAAVEQEGLKTRATVGAIKAAEAAGNVDVNTGSNVDVRSSAAELGELDALTVRANAANKTYGYLTNATSFEGQAALDKAEASQASTAGLFGAAGSLLSGASSATSNYLKWQQVAGAGGGAGTFQSGAATPAQMALFNP